MKSIILIFVLAFLILPVFGQKKMTDSEMAGLKGKVKSVINEEADAEEKGGKLIEKPKKLTFEQLFDGEGNITEHLNPSLNEKQVYTFINGDKTYKSSHIKPEKSTDVVIGFSSSDKSNARDTRYGIKINYDYDDKGKIKEERDYLNNGELVSRTAYKYDENGRIEEVKNYNATSQWGETTYKYDNEGNLIERKYVSVKVKGENGITNYSFSDYQLDSQGNWIKRVQTTSNKRDGKLTIEKSVNYRKISYYEN